MGQKEVVRRRKRKNQNSIGDGSGSTIPSNSCAGEDNTPSLPLRKFSYGHEPQKKKVNTYFSLNHFDVVKKALDKDQLETLMVVVLACCPSVLTTDVEMDEVDVISVMPAPEEQQELDSLVWGTDQQDPSVDYLVTLINSKQKFSHASWKGGVRANDIFRTKNVVEEGESSQSDIHTLIEEVSEACYEKIRASNEELGTKFQDMLDLAVTEIQSDVILKFSALERMIVGLFVHPQSRPASPIILRPATSEPTNHSDAKSPEENKSTSYKDKSPCDPKSPDTIVRNVLGDLNLVEDEPNEWTNPDNDTFAGNFGEIPNQLPVANNGLVVPDSIRTTSDDLGENEPLIQEQLSASGKDEDEVPPNIEDVEIGGVYLDKLEKTNVGEDNIEPPTFSLGLTQEIKKRRLFNLCYVRKNKRTKHLPSSYADFVMEPTGKSKHDSVSTMFQPPPTDMVVQIRNHMVEPCYFPDYKGHTLFEVHFNELFEPSKLMSTEVMDTLVEYLHQTIVEQSKTKHPPNFDFLDFSFLNHIGLLHELIEPAKRRKKLSVKSQLVDYVKSRRDLYTKVDTLLCPFLMEERHWVGVVVNLSDHELIVLDCNHDIIEDPMVDALLTPFAYALPYVTRQLAFNKEMKHDTLEPFSIRRPQIKTQLIEPELSGIGSLMLLQLHGHNKLDDNIQLTRDHVVGASQKYASELFKAITETTEE
ncbi:unnamed protein product [Cochlearia groenlandica]